MSNPQTPCVLGIVHVLKDGVSPPGSYESVKAQVEAVGERAAYLPMRLGAFPSSVATIHQITQLAGTALTRLTHVMVIPPEAVIDEERVSMALSCIDEDANAIWHTATAGPDVMLHFFDGTGDRSERDRAAEAYLRGWAKESLGSLSPSQIHEIITQLASTWNEGKIFLQTAKARLNDPEATEYETGMNAQQAFRWWEVPGAVGTIMPKSVFEAAVAMWSEDDTTEINSDFDRLLRIYSVLHPEITAKDEGPSINPWSSVFEVDSKHWNLEASYRAARGGERVRALPSIAILTPAYGGMHARYVSSLLRVVKDLHDHAIPCQTILTEGESLVTRARHNLVHLFLMSTCTHMLFWDADLELLDATVVRKMLSTQKHVVGGAYPFRDGSGRMVINFLETDEQGEPLSLGTHEERNVAFHVDEAGCAEVRHVPTGFLLVSREAIVELYEAHPELLYQDTGFQPGMRGSPRWDVFGTALLGHNYLSEDWAFCERWRALKSELVNRHKVYVYVDAEFVHHGIGGSHGSLKALLRKRTS